ncbi:hypothetical protein HAX54_033008, partial [Datura stramonium]|nr:hypothetical protein [Datura stramonium]
IPCCPFDVTKTKEPKVVNGPVLYVNECNGRIDNMLSHLYDMQMLQLRMNGDRMARVDSDIESSDVEEEDSEMGEAALAPTDDED